MSAFVSRPVLHIRSKESGTNVGTFNFSDALARYGENLTAAELGEAYRRAGAAFKGQLQQNFVVLNEQGAGGTLKVQAEPNAAGGNLATPRKRPRDTEKNDSSASMAGRNPKVTKNA